MLNSTISNYSHFSNFTYSTNAYTVNVPNLKPMEYTHLHISYTDCGVPTYRSFCFINGELFGELDNIYTHYAIIDHLTGELKYEFFGNNPYFIPTVDELIKNGEKFDIYHDSWHQIKTMQHNRYKQRQNGKWSKAGG